MTFDAERLYQLLPAVHRMRDTGHGEPLRALLAVIAEQVEVVEENLAQLYNDQFIETCADWVVPYLGDLLGCRMLHAVSPKTMSARAEVGHTIAFRRRKGTASMLEQLARDVTGWDARVVEFFQRLGWTQYMNHLRPEHAYAPDLRRHETVEFLNTPFETAAHTVDVRSITRGEGKYNLPNIGLFLWRLGDYRLTDSRAARVDSRRWHFHPLGLDAPLFTRVEAEEEINHLAEPINVPLPISRRLLADHLPRYYGRDKSIVVTLDGTDVLLDNVCSCDLSDQGGTWAHVPQVKIAIDPVLGRLALPPGLSPALVTVCITYGFSAEMSGGEYDRAATFEPELSPVVTVQSPSALAPALAAATSGVVRLDDSARYEEALSVTVAAGQRLEVRAGNLCRPTLRRGGDAPSGGDWVLQGGEGASLILNGLLIQGHTLRVPATAANRLTRLTLRHCTIAPGPDLALLVESPDVHVVIDRCVLGRIRAPVTSRVEIRDSIVDASNPHAIAFAAPSAPDPKVNFDHNPQHGAALVVERSTVIGPVFTHFLELASNTMFLSRVDSLRKQTGCVRFSFLPLASQTPWRFRCQPAGPADALRVRPRFTSLRFGDPGYAQLSPRCAREVREGADDEAEMGAFHDLFQPQRETNLRIRLKEYLRFRLEAGIFYVT